MAWSLLARLIEWVIKGAGRAGYGAIKAPVKTAGNVAVGGTVANLGIEAAEITSIIPAIYEEAPALGRIMHQGEAEEGLARLQDISQDVMLYGSLFWIGGAAAGVAGRGAAKWGKSLLIGPKTSIEKGVRRMTIKSKRWIRNKKHLRKGSIPHNAPPGLWKKVAERGLFALAAIRQTISKSPNLAGARTQHSALLTRMRGQVDQHLKKAGKLTPEEEVALKGLLTETTAPGKLKQYSKTILGSKAGLTALLAVFASTFVYVDGDDAVIDLLDWAASETFLESASLDEIEAGSLLDSQWLEVAVSELDETLDKEIGSDELTIVEFQALRAVARTIQKHWGHEGPNMLRALQAVEFDPDKLERVYEIVRNRSF